MALAGAATGATYTVHRYSLGDQEVTASYSTPLTGKAVLAELPFEVLLPQAASASVHLMPGVSFGVSPAQAVGLSDGVIMIAQCDTTERFGANSARVSGAVPTMIRVAQNTPNPFSPTTTVSLDLLAPGFVRVEVLNALGECVLMPVATSLPEGRHQITIDGGALASGAYRYVVTWTDGLTTTRESRTMLLVK